MTIELSEMPWHLLEALPDGLFIIRPDGEIVRATRRAGRLFGYAEEELLGKGVEELLPERFRTAHREHVRRFFSDPRARPMGTGLDLVGLRKDGSEFPLDVSLSPVTTEEGLCVFAAVRDATAHKALQEALRLEQARYHDLYENAPDMLASVDASTGKIIVCNQTFATALGLTKEEIVGRTVFELHHSDHRDQAREIFSTFRETGVVQDAEIVLKRRDGTKLEVSLSVSAVRDEKGNILYSRSSCRDISQRKQVERALRQSEERFRTVFDSAPLGMALVDRTGRPFRSNRAILKMLGRGEEALPRTRCVELTHPEDAPESDRLFQELVVGKRDQYRLEKRYQRPDGSVIWGDTAVAAVRDAAGQFAYAIPTVADVTGRKETEEALRRSEAQLRQVQKMEAVGELTAGIAHDFNNLLTAILSNIELVGQSLPPALADLHEDLEEARQAGRQAAELIRKLLAFSRRAPMTLVTVDLGVLIRDLSKLLRRVVPEHIAIEVGVRDPSVVVLADPGAVQQILLNLVTNARDAMPDGGHLRIEVQRTWLDEGYHASHPWVAPGEYIAITVSDTGVGMDEATRQRIFDPFFTTKPPGVGTGLGMAMVYGLVKEQRCFVHVYSEPGRGTSVKIYFPAAREAPPGSGTSEASAPPRGGTETILVVEDEPSIRRAAKRALASQGYTVLEAADGEEALAILRSQESAIDLVLLDLVMPKLGGRQVYEALRREGKRVKILFTSGYAVREVQNAANLPPEIPFLHKPWALTDLFLRVRDVLDQKGEAGREG